MNRPDPAYLSRWLRAPRTSASPAESAYAIECHIERDHRIAGWVMLVGLVCLLLWIHFTWGTP